MKKYIPLLIIVFISNLYANTNGAYGELLLGRGYNHLGEQIDSTHSSDWTLSGKLGVGYKIDKNIGLEVGYEQFGQQRFNNMDDNSASVTANEYAVEIQTVLRFALSDNFSLSGKIGPAYVQATQSINGGDSETTNKYQSTNSAWRPDYALGASYVLEDLPGLELTAIYSHIIKDNNIPDADLYAAGLIFNF
ncbi:MAG: hypothetical protein EXR81_04340 [Gammaproteobacteria bacterium]|nr:hypothetical protein [Gammaproteobacteria bacterium]